MDIRDIIRQARLIEESGAGDVGTDKLKKKYKKDTPGEDIEEAAEWKVSFKVLDGTKKGKTMFTRTTKKDAVKVGDVIDVNADNVKNPTTYNKAKVTKIEPLKEDFAATATTTADIPTKDGIVKRKDAKQYDVNAALYRRFQNGRNKYEQWSKYFDMTNEEEAKICDEIKKSKKTIILRNSESGEMISLRRRSSDGR